MLPCGTPEMTDNSKEGMHFVDFDIVMSVTEVRSEELP